MNAGTESISVFISHAYEDSAFAKHLASDLSKHNYAARTFLEILPADASLPDNQLDGRLAAAIAEDSFFVPVLTPASVASRWVNVEIDTALATETSLHELRILPALAQECELPIKLGLRTPTDFTKSYGDGLNDLLARLSAPKRGFQGARSRKNESSAEASRFVGNELRSFLAAHPEALWDLAPQEFEQLVAALLEEQGFRVELTNRSHDGGIDLVAIGGRDTRGIPILIECKRYSRGRRVGVGVVRDLYGALARKGAKHGMIVTTSDFTSTAAQEAERMSSLNRDNWKLDQVDMDKLMTWLAGSSDLGVGLTFPLTQMRARHGELVDKRFLGTLSEDEHQELKKLESALDQVERSYYEPVTTALRKERDRLLAEQSDVQEDS